MASFLFILIIINFSFLTMDYENDINNDFSNEIDDNLKIQEFQRKLILIIIGLMQKLLVFVRVRGRTRILM